MLLMPRAKLAPVLLLLVAALGLGPWSGSRSVAEEPGEEDAKLLKSEGIATDGPGLLAFFRTRPIQVESSQRLEELVARLAGYSYRDRDKASRLLIAQGAAAVPVLKKALTTHDVDEDTVRRVQQCLQKIENGDGPELAVAAARLLVIRQPAGAVEVLLDYLPGVQDEWVKDEVLASLGALAVRHDSVNPVLMAALQADAPGRRATAAYVLGQRGGLAFREQVRQRLVDPDPTVRRAAVWGLAGKGLVQTVGETLAADQALLKQNHVAADEAGLLDFLRRRTLTAADEQQMRLLVRQLGDDTHRVRAEASRQLTARGTPALPLLKQALGSADLETVRRARLCIDAIQGGPGPALPAAAIRVLTRPVERAATPAAAIRALLNYAPFADDASVEEAVVHGLSLLSVREPRLDPALTAALQDGAPARRAAAAYVLGRLGTRADCLAVRALLDDPSLTVRLRAAQGLVAARDRTAVPRLIALLSEAPLPALWQAEDLLHRIGGEGGPSVYVEDGGADARRKATTAWAEWWRVRGPALDLARVDLEDRRLGLTLICEYDSMQGRPGGQVWECGRDGKARWKITGLQGPMDAQVLPGGRVLIAENSGQRVTERDLTGAVRWQHSLNNTPIACQRLPNGNTFIATYNEVLEVTPTHQVVYSHNRGPGFYLFSAQKLRNGHIVCMTAQGWILELDAATGKELRTVNLGQHGWCGVEALPGGKFLVALMAPGQVREVDDRGQASAEWRFPGVFRATRLPNGHTLVASMTSRKVAELDRAGQSVWEHVCEGRPWQVRAR
jgi:HEAT repeat protein